MAKEITAAAAAKHFRNVSVQTATPVKVKGEGGIERPAFKTEKVALAEEHILAATDYGNRIVIVTIDGKKHEAATRGEKAAA